MSSTSSSTGVALASSKRHVSMDILNISFSSANAKLVQEDLEFYLLWLGDMSTDFDRPFLPFLDSILNLTPVVDTPFI